MAACPQCRGIVRSQLQRAFRVGQPLRGSASLEVAPCAVVVGTWVRRVELDGRIEIGYGAFVIAVFEIRGAAVVVTLGVGWHDLDQLVVVNYSPLEFALAEVDAPAVQVGRSVLRVDR